jgi:hypothetical protein
MVVNRPGIASEPDVVFDWLTHPMGDHAWNPMLMDAAQITTGPPGCGARYRILLPGTGWMTVEYTRYERPSK